ncbi:MAG: phosphatase PAP2 family protein [Sphaerochaetaceae bacterium]|nr:phosphatase PAP2 family protein [Sphaerochaetaceae bacterium]
MAGRHSRMCFIMTLSLIMVLTPLCGAEVSDSSEVPPFDRALMFPYSKPLSLVSDVTQSISVLAPALFALAAPTSDWVGIAMLYGASSVLSFGTRTLLKSTIDRSRPYTYAVDPPTAPPIGEYDHDRSFPSGHTIMAFTGAAFTHTLFALRYPESRWRMPVTSAAWTFAAATAILRVASGNHFVTDVLAGAAIGTFFGAVVPYLASRADYVWKRDNVSMYIGPTAVALHVRY